MKNYCLLILLLVVTSGYSQSNYSFNLVAKVGVPQWETSENSTYQPLSEIQGRSYSLGIEANKFLNQKRSLSIRYGFLNQFNQFLGKSYGQVDYDIDIFDATYTTQINSLDVLLPIKLQGHLGNWSIFGGVIPTYHFNTKINQSTFLVPTTIDSEKIEYETVLNVCNPLFEQCFSQEKFPFLRDFEFQYILGIQYQIKRFSFFCEFTDYMWTRPINPNYGSDLAFIDFDFAYSPDFGSFGSSLSFGTAFTIY